MNRFLIAAVALGAAAYAVYAGWLPKPNFLESVGNTPIPAEAPATTSEAPIATPPAEAVTQAPPTPAPALAASAAPATAAPQPAPAQAHHTQHAKKPKAH
jgi:hypothetical protein